MNRIARALCLTILASILLSSCSTSAQITAEYTPAQIAQAVISAQDNIAQLEPLFPDDDYFADYLYNIYQINADIVKDGVIYYASGMLADEIAVFLLADNSDVKDTRDALLNYKERRAGAFFGYAPEQSAILENGLVVSHGDYVALLICEDPQNAQSVFMASFSSNPPRISGGIGTLPPDVDNESADPAAETDDKKQPEANEDTITGDNAIDNETDSNGSDGFEEDSTETDNTEIDNNETESNETENSKTGSSETENNETGSSETGNNETENNGQGNGSAGNGETDAHEDVYDHAAVLRAWRSGNSSGLSYKNRRILEACIEVINELITENMSDYEKQLAIHDWIIDRVRYDEETLSNSPNASPDPDNDNPYGAIFGRRAICSGYSSTFQLFMDMVGIECITVDGYYSVTGAEHAWNMVRIDGEWYCVDVTWNDPIGGSQSALTRYRYFNVTSAFMWETGHRWDESTTPVADSGKLFFE